MKNDKDLNIRDSFLVVTCWLLVGYTWLLVEILDFRVQITNVHQNFLYSRNDMKTCHFVGGIIGINKRCFHSDSVTLC